MLDKFGMTHDHLKAMSAVTGKLKEWRPAREVLTTVQAVPTVFPQYDVATRVMGNPVGRIIRLRGPSNEGKTSWLIGMMRSYLARGHFAGFADAERTSPPEWLQTLMGEMRDHPGFVAIPVRSYEQVVDGVREYAEGIATARDAGHIPAETTGIVCVDSLRKLTPKNLLAKLLKEGSGKRGIDGMGGRAAQVKAALNAQWLDELVPLMADTKVTIVLVAREIEDQEASLYGDGVKVAGGAALFFDSSLDLRITRQWITDPEDVRRIYGERHRVVVYKTKVGKKEYKKPQGHFHTSNGVVTPEGFDRPRDVLELAKEWGVVEVKGSSHRFDGKQLGAGELKSILKLHEEPELCAEIELAARQAASKNWYKEQG